MQRDLENNLKNYGLTTEQAPANGNCFYTAILYQLERKEFKYHDKSIELDVQSLRKLATKQIEDDYSVLDLAGKRDYISKIYGVDIDRPNDLPRRLDNRTNDPGEKELDNILRQYTESNNKKNSVEYADDLIRGAIAKKLGLNIVVISDAEKPLIDKKTDNIENTVYLKFQNKHYDSLRISLDNKNKQNFPKLEEEVKKTTNSALVSHYNSILQAKQNLYDNPSAESFKKWRTIQSNYIQLLDKEYDEITAQLNGNKKAPESDPNRNKALESRQGFLSNLSQYLIDDSKAINKLELTLKKNFDKIKKLEEVLTKDSQNNSTSAIGKTVFEKGRKDQENQLNQSKEDCRKLLPSSVSNSAEELALINKYEKLGPNIKDIKKTIDAAIKAGEIDSKQREILSGLAEKIQDGQSLYEFRIATDLLQRNENKELGKSESDLYKQFNDKIGVHLPKLEVSNKNSNDPTSEEQKNESSKQDNSSTKQGDSWGEATPIIWEQTSFVDRYNFTKDYKATNNTEPTEENYKAKDKEIYIKKYKQDPSSLQPTLEEIKKAEEAADLQLSQALSENSALNKDELKKIYSESLKNFGYEQHKDGNLSSSLFSAEYSDSA
jgi:hypothetical protein